MPVRTVVSGKAKVQGESANVMFDPDGRGVLTSLNKLPNPDGIEETAGGEVRFWPGFDAPPAPEGWWYYYADSSPALRLSQRQGTRAQDIEDDYITLTDPPTRGGPLPDPTDYAPVAAPVVEGSRIRTVKAPGSPGVDGWEAPGVVDLVPVENIGYGAQEDWLVSIFWIVGNPNAGPKRLLHTRTCKQIRVRLPQGKGFRLPLPQEGAPAGTTAVGIAMCRVSQGYDGLILQQIKRIGRWMPEYAHLRGPFERGIRVNQRGNTTYVGKLNELPPPRVDRVSRAGAVIPAGAYRWCVEEKTEFGYTASGEWSGWRHVRATSRGEAFRVRPRRRVPGSQGWRLIFQYSANGPDKDAPVLYVSGEDGKTDLGRGEPAFVHTRMKTVKKRIEVPDDTPNGQDPENLKPHESPSASLGGGTGRPPNGWDAVNARKQVTYWGDSRYMSVFRAAADKWEAVCGVRFVETSRSTANVTVTDGDLEGSYIGMCYHYEDGSTRLVFDVVRMEASSAEKQATVALHEEGHLLGMPHTTGASLMTTSVGDASPDAPTAYDANLASKVWGPAASGASEATAMAGTKTITVERRVPDSFRYPKGDKSGEDRSGIPDPDIALTESGDTGSLVDLTAANTVEGWTLLGDNPVTPGTKRIRFTWSVPGEIPGEDSESAPSTAVTVRVPSVGGAATHTLRIHRPPGTNEVQNSRFIKRRLDDTEARWTRDPEGPTGVTHTTTDGRADHDDKGNRNDDQDVRRDERIDIRDLKKRVVRLKLSLPERASGRAEAILRFLREDIDALGNATYAEIRRDVLDDIEDLEERFIERSHGPVGSGADIEWPATATHVQRVLRHIGSDAAGTGARNLKSALEHIGQRRGGVMPPKRKKRLLSALTGVPAGIMGAEAIGVTDGAEDPEEEYPLGGHCVAIDGWHDSPQRNVSASLAGPYHFEIDLIPGGWTTVGNVSVSTIKPIYGNESLRCSNANAPGSPAYMERQVDGGEPLRSERSDRFVFKFERLPTSGGYRIYQLLDGDGITPLCWLVMGQAGNLSLWTRDANNNVVNQGLIRRFVRDHDECDVEVHVIGAGTANGRVRVWFAKQDNRRTLRRDITGIDWTGLRVRNARCGLDVPSDPASTAIVKYDHLNIQDRGSEAWIDLPGRMYEYWAPEGTPASERWGFKGVRGSERVRIPIKPSTEYFFSFYLWYRAITEAGSPLGFVIEDEEGTVIRRIDSAARGIMGRRGWHRRWQKFTTDERAAAIVFDRGDLGDGLIRVMALQLEEALAGQTSPSPYSNENALSGTLTVKYDLRVPGIPTNSWISGYNAIERIRGSGWVGTAEHGVTGVSLRFASAPEIIDGQEPAWTPLTPDPFEPPIGPKTEAWMIEATLETDDATKSPEVEDLYLDFVRKVETVCRGDGSEFPGGAVPIDFPAPKAVPRITPTRSLDNTPGFEVSGKKPGEVSGWGIGMFYDEGVEMFYADLGEGPAGDSTIWIEDLGYRTVVEVLDADFSEVDRSRNVSVPGYRPLPSGSTYEPGAYEFSADGLTGIVQRKIAL